MGLPPVRCRPTRRAVAALASAASAQNARQGARERERWSYRPRQGPSTVCQGRYSRRGRPERACGGKARLVAGGERRWRRRGGRRSGSPRGRKVEQLERVHLLWSRTRWYASVRGILDTLGALLQPVRSGVDNGACGRSYAAIRCDLMYRGRGAGVKGTGSPSGWP